MNKHSSKTESFYHVVTERPMHKGQVISFDSENKNGVGKRVDRIEFLRNLNGTQIVDMDDFDKLVFTNFEYWCSVSDREKALEKIRKERFPQYPSRMACLYTSADLEDAQKWAKYFKKANRVVFQIVLLENEGNFFTGDANNCWRGKVTENEAHENSIRYWTNSQNTKNLKPVPETIIDGRIYVVDIIEMYLSKRRDDEK